MILVAKKEIWHFLLPATLLAYMLFAVCFSEIIPVNNGLGWDGRRYAGFIKYFESIAKNKELPHEAVRRIFPMMVIFYSHKCFGKKPSTDSIIMGFRIMNLALLFLSSVVWIRIARMLKYSTKTSILFFFSLFVSYAVLKMSFFYPVLMDTSGMCWSVYLLYLYLTRRDTFLLLFTIVGAFIFPMLSVCGALLYMFPRRDSPKEMRARSRLSHLIESARRMIPKKINVILFMFIMYGFILSFIFLFFLLGYKPATTYNNPEFNPKLVLSFACAAFYLYAVIKSVDFDIVLGKLRDELIGKRIVVIALIYLVIQVVTTRISSGAVRSIFPFVAHNVYHAVANPFVFILAHILYFGPGIILIIVHWKQFREFVNTQSVGFMLIVYFGLILGIGSLSRQFVAFVPFLIYALYRSIGMMKFNTRYIVLFVSLSILYSKIWYRMGEVPYSGDFFEFPYQRYFMAQGPYISDTMYYVQGIITVVAIALLYACARACSHRASSGHMTSYGYQREGDVNS